MKNTPLISILIVASIASAFHTPEWPTFKATHGKQYSSPMEEQFRMKVYLENKKKIEEHNMAYENGQVTYKMKMNHFGDLMSHEFKELMKGYKKSTNYRRLVAETYKPHDFTSLPERIDWRERGAVTPVRSEGHCAASWAFSPVESLEGQVFIKKGKLVPLSVQNVIDCCKKCSAGSCGGGLRDQVFQYVMDNGGIDTEESYPFEDDMGKCRFNPDTIGTTESGYIDIAEGDELALQDAVANVGPISVAIDAGHNSFQFYSSGIYSEPLCDSYSLNHAALLVGYGSEHGHDYWLVKNSWGTGWGEGGYIKMIRNYKNNCGIASTAIYPLV